MSPQYGVVLFDSTQRAIQAERVLKAAGLPVKLIPVPRQISSDCGVCLRFLWEDHQRVEEVLHLHRVLFAGIRQV
ncbi:MAG: DUF3343 domain-containing protein [Anaerolineae bacterium]